MADIRTQHLRKGRTRRRRTLRVRKLVRGNPDRPRLCVHRSLSEMYAQIIDDTQGRTLVAASTRDQSVRDTFEKKDSKTDKSFKVGLRIAELAKAQGIETVSFDRHGYLYHGRVKAVAEGARKGGLDF
jgi:large subunit ribosomal protein L18